MKNIMMGDWNIKYTSKNSNISHHCRGNGQFETKLWSVEWYSNREEEPECNYCREEIPEGILFAARLLG